MMTFSMAARKVTYKYFSLKSTIKACKDQAFQDHCSAQCLFILLALAASTIDSVDSDLLYNGDLLDTRLAEGATLRRSQAALVSKIPYD